MRLINNQEYQSISCQGEAFVKSLEYLFARVSFSGIKELIESQVNNYNIVEKY